MAIQLGSAYGKISLNTNEFMSGINQGVRGLKDLSTAGKTLGSTLKTSFSNIQSSFSSIGSTLTRGVTIPVLATAGLFTAAGVSAIKTYADFEKQMSGVQAILGATADEAAKLKELAINLGLDPNLIVSTQESAQVFEELAKNGLTAQQILDGAAKSAIALANATGTDFGTAAQIASTGMQLFNLNAKDFEGVVNNITGVANSSRFSVEDFAQAMAMGGGVAAQVGIPIEDFATAIAGLANSFSSGSDAGTSFKVFLQRLVPDTAPAIEAMTDLGIITEEAGNRFFDSEGNMKSLSDIAGILQEAFKDLSDEQKILALTNIFGTDAMRAAAAMAELGAAGFDTLSESMAKTDAAANAATRMNNLAGDIEILKGVVESFQIKFVDTFKDKLREPIKVFTEFLANNSDKIMAMLTSLADILGTMATSLASSIRDNGPSIIEFFQKMIDALPAFIDKMIEVGTVVAPHLQKLFDAIMSMDPETLAIILEVVAALAVLGPILSGIAGFMSVLISIGTIISSVVGAIGGMGTFLTAVGTAITTVVVPALVAIGTALLPIIIVLAAVAFYLGILYLMWKTNFLGMRDNVTMVVDVLKALWQALLAFLSGDIEGALMHLGEAFEAVKVRLEKAFDFLEGWRIKSQEFQVFMAEMALNIIIAIQKLVDDIKAKFDIDWSEIANRIVNGLVTGLENGASAVANAARNMALGALAAAKAVLGINSDSRAFMQLGGFSASGLAQGMRTPATTPNANVFSGASSGAGATAARGTSNVINIYNPSAEAATNSVDRTLRRLSYLGVLR